jgi:hypothetical protein
VVKTCRPLQGAVTAYELGPIGRPRRLPTAEIQESNAGAEFRIPRVPREERPGIRLQ